MMSEEQRAKRAELVRAIIALHRRKGLPTPPVLHLCFSHDELAQASEAEIQRNKAARMWRQ